VRFICGTTKDAKRRIFYAESAPTIENIDDLTEQLSEETYDWGPSAEVHASECTARIILLAVTGVNDAFRCAALYAEQVVRPKLDTDRMWILPVEEVELWLRANRLIM
jgi:hypothetical protein